MVVKIKNEYSVSINKYEHRIYHADLDDVLYDYREWLNEDTLGSEDALREDLEEYIKDNCMIAPINFGADEELDEYSTEFTLLNWEEIYPHIADLVEIPVEPTCCERAPYKSNFCPTCGNRLIKK